jgi:hypothetical protein
MSVRTTIVFWTPIVALAGVGTGWLAFDRACATPITLAFDASVTHVPSDFSMLHLPFSLTEGQDFTGKYVFGSGNDLVGIFHGSDGARGTVQLEVETDQLSCPVNFGNIAFVGLPSPPSGIGTSIQLTYLSPFDVTPPWAGAIDGQRWNAELTLTGKQGSVSDSALLNADTWNQLNVERQLDLEFAYLLSGTYHFVTVTASVGDLRAVPEPSTASLAGFSLAPLAAPFAFRRRRHRRRLPQRRL